MNHKHIAVRELPDCQVVEIALGPPPANIVTMDLMELTERVRFGRIRGNT